MMMMNLDHDIEVRYMIVDRKDHEQYLRFKRAI